MGLDMYLYADTSISGYDWKGGTSKAAYEAVLDASGMRSFADPNTPSASLTVCVAYWRKANAIHQWFVDNVQGGVDECQRGYTNPDQLRELLDLTTDAAAAYDAGDKAKASELLVPTGGFFFGSTEVDEGYRLDLQLTIDQLTHLFAAIAAAGEDRMLWLDLYYQSSW